MKTFLRKLVRSFTKNVPVRGRHKLAEAMGALGNGKELLNINGFLIEIDHSILWSRHLYYGIYEESLINFLRKNIKEGDIVFDPGANMGYITANCLNLVGKSGKVFAFEPSKTCYTMLSTNNKLENFSNLTLLNAALSDTSGEAPFYDTPRVVSRGYACLEEISTPTDGNKYSVPTYSIDYFCKENNIPKIKFLKLDIEGAELMALKGATQMLSDNQIDYILVETFIDTKDPKKTEMNRSITGILEKNGYAPFLPERNGTLNPIELQKESYLRTDIIWKRKGI